MATQSKIIHLPRLTANDSVKLISVICWHAKKCPCITEKKKNLLRILHKKASQRVAKMTLTSEISLISAGSTSPTEGLGVQHPSPGIWPTSPVAACLAAGHIHCLEVTEKWRRFIWGKGLAVWGVHMAHSTTTSILPNPCWITSQREACKTCSALCKKKPTFPDCSNSITAKHNT